MANKDQALKVDLTGGLLTISVGVSVLCKAVMSGDALDIYGEGEITDEDGFAREIVTAIEWEEETGSNAIHRMLDAAAVMAVEDGAEHIRFPGDE